MNEWPWVGFLTNGGKRRVMKAGTEVQRGGGERGDGGRGKRGGRAGGGG